MAATEAGRTSSIVSRIAFGFPGRFKMSALPRKPAVCLDSTAVGTTLHQAQHGKTLLGLDACLNVFLSPNSS